MTDPKGKQPHADLMQCAARLLQWKEAGAYGAVEVHFQAGKITHLKEITTHKLDTGKK